jgi:PTS system mannose-specific IIB component/fructoselysine and glucoselysine-specific PTS system IIB component
VSAVTGGGRRGYLLFRVDDRLLHGQVALGWGGPLGARAYLVADDRLAADPDAGMLYELAAPPGSAVRIATLADAVGGAGLDPTQTILLVRGVTEAAFLLRAGVPGPLALGGLHAHAGARPLLPYLFLTAEEETLLGDLAREGYAIRAQDLPRSPRIELGKIPGFTGGGAA